jgi:1-acyl-sn-glycerol-3-phosphate acyltransferase
MIRFLYAFWSAITTIVFALSFFLFLLVWEIFIRIAYLFGYQVSQQVMHTLMWWLLQLMKIVGSSVKFLPAQCTLEHNRPLILVSNHQSLFDIVFAFWYFRKFHVKFVSKKELATFTPTVAFHLRNGHHAIIDRKDREQATAAIAKMAQKAEKEHFAALIYPEGSRSRNGKLREFKLRGLSVMLENMPSALVVPICIKGSWQLTPNKFTYVPFGTKCSFEVLQAIEPRGMSAEDVLSLCEQRIREVL